MKSFGLVIRSQSGFYTVQTEKSVLVCRLRGRHKRGPRLGDVIAIGDRVEVTQLDGESGVIEEILPRTRMLVRLAPTPRGEYQQIIIANPDQAVFVFACSHPEPKLGMLDRFLVIAEKQGIPAHILVNKIDIMGEKQAGALFDHYQQLGYPVLYTSAKTGDGIAELRRRLIEKISVFSGPSGVGKSTLLNVLLPGLGLSSNEISQATLKGKHTTVVKEMYPLPEGGYIADTPGLKALALWDIRPEELDGFFPELRPLVAECQYNDCTHIHEPGCAVLEAVEDGRVHPHRYQSYVRMRLGEQAE
jgi:ribosome biogenesis GTPase